MEIKFNLDAEAAIRKTQTVAERMAYPGPALEKIGLYMVSSVQRNFQVGGRPIRWKPSKRAVEQGGKTLVDTGRLKKSINKKVVGNTVYIGTNVKYAAIHQFGGALKKAANFGYRVLKPGTKSSYAKRYTVLKQGTKISARPFLLIQAKDELRIKRILSEYIDGKN